MNPRDMEEFDRFLRRILNLPDNPFPFMGVVIEKAPEFPSFMDFALNTDLCPFCGKNCQKPIVINRQVTEYRCPECKKIIFREEY